jgi:hypothetical protein
MTKLVKTAGLASVLVALLASMKLELRAAEPENGVREGQAVVTALGANASAITYWFAQSDGWHVVTTVYIVLGLEGADERRAVARFSAVLSPGQAQVISVPYPLGEQQQVLRVRR